MLRKLGIILIVLSFVFYGLILLIPTLSVSLQTKTILTGTLVVVGEISFWSGGLILGKELVQKYRSALNPMNWFKRKP